MNKPDWKRLVQEVRQEVKRALADQQAHKPSTENKSPAPAAREFDPSNFAERREIEALKSRLEKLEANNQPDRGKKPLHRKVSFWVAVASFCAAVGSFWQGHESRKNAVAANASYQLTRKQFQDSERPWVTIRTARLYGDPKFTKDQHGVAIELQNTGHTPARELIILVDVNIHHRSVGNDPFPIDFEKQELALLGTAPSKSVLGPNAIQTVYGMADLTGHEKEIMELRTGVIFIRLVGTATYEDVLGHPHRTTFCLESTGPVAYLENCVKWNTAD